MKNKPIIAAAGLLAILSFPVLGQEDLSLKYAATIEAADLEKHLTYLASDDLEGRDTGEKGQKLAAEYLVSFYQEKGLDGPVAGSFLQPFELSSVRWEEVELRVGRTDLVLNEDFVFIGDADMKKRTRTDLVFLGLSSEENLAKVDVEGKLVGLWAIGSRSSEVVDKVFEAGADGVVLVTMEGQANFDRIANRYKTLSGRGRLGFDEPTEHKPIFMVSSEMMGKLFETPVEQLKEAAKNNPESIPSQKVRYQVQKDKLTVGTENVLAYLEGTDKKKRYWLFLPITITWASTAREKLTTVRMMTAREPYP